MLYSQSEARPLGARPPPQGLKRAASKVAHFTAFGHLGLGGLGAEEWESKRREHDRLVKDGHKANNAGSAQGAMESFEGAAQAFPKVGA